MTILYLHGMASSHACPIAQNIQKAIPQARMIVPDLNIEPNTALRQIKRILKDEEVDLIIGHSLGGFMAQKIRGYQKILINPSLGMSYMEMFIGDNRYKQPRLDGCDTWHVTRQICERYKDLEATEFDNLTANEKEITKGFFGRCDFFTYLSSIRFKRHYKHRVLMPGGHYPSEDTILKYIIPSILTLMEQSKVDPQDDDLPLPRHLRRGPIGFIDEHPEHRSDPSEGPSTQGYLPGRDANGSISPHLHDDNYDRQHGMW